MKLPAWTAQTPVQPLMLVTDGPKNVRLSALATAACSGPSSRTASATMTFRSNRMACILLLVAVRIDVDRGRGAVGRSGDGDRRVGGAGRDAGIEILGQQHAGRR